MNHEKTWLAEFQGQTIHGIRPVHIDESPVPSVRILFKSGRVYYVDVKDGVFFEACLINTLRRAQPVHDVIVKTEGKNTKIDIRSKSFPLLTLRAVNLELERGEFPFLLRRDA